MNDLSSIVPRALLRVATTYNAPVILTDVNCDGSEESILECSNSGYDDITDCDYIAVAQCEGDQSVY